MGCHRKIDPWGIAFEEYDAVGNWQRDGVGASSAQAADRSNRSMPRPNCPLASRSTACENCATSCCRSKSDEFRRAMLRKVMAYALGRSLTLGDIEAADALVPALRDRGDRLPALIELIAASEPFQSK